MIFIFRAHWCPPCRSFTSKLAKFYSELNDEMKSKFDIIFLSWDENEEDFKEYFKEMPWKALPFSGKHEFVFFFFEYLKQKKRIL